MEAFWLKSGNKAEQLKQCLEIYLSHYWRRWGDTEASEASPDEMQRKTDELRSLAAQEETPPSIYRTNLAFNVATLQLGNITPNGIYNNNIAKNLKQ